MNFAKDNQIFFVITYMNEPLKENLAGIKFH